MADDRRGVGVSGVTYLFSLLTIPVMMIALYQVETHEAFASQLDLQVDRLAKVISSPRLSGREPGIHIEACEQTQSLGINAVEGEDYCCGVLTVPQNWDEPDGPYRIAPHDSEGLMQG